MATILARVLDFGHLDKRILSPACRRLSLVKPSLIHIPEQYVLSWTKSATKTYAQPCPSVTSARALPER